MPTLKPHLAASAPRLGTGCSLGFTRLGLSPNYITRTELAHPPDPIIADFDEYCRIFESYKDVKPELSKFQRIILEALGLRDIR
jgi:hypothetical protein